MKGAVTVLTVAVAVLLQAGVVNRLPLPWGAGPDLVVLAVVALAAALTPVAGAFTGFVAGLAIDVLPPADHEIGRMALLLCLTGYLVASLRGGGERSRARPYLVALVAAIGVALGFAFIGLVLGDPRVSLSGVAVTTAVSTALTMVVSPLVLYPVGRVMRLFTEDTVFGHPHGTPYSYSSLPTSPWSSGGF